MLDFQADSPDSTDKITADAELHRVAILAAKQRNLQKELARLEERVKQTKKELVKVSTIDLPDLMVNELGLRYTVLADGATLEIKPGMSVSVPKKNKEEIAQWLLDNELGSLVKTTVTYTFDKGEMKKMETFINQLLELGYMDYDAGSDFNTGSLKAALKELYKAGKGDNIPEKKMGVYKYEQAVIK